MRGLSGLVMARLMGEREGERREGEREGERREGRREGGGEGGKGEGREDVIKCKHVHVWFVFWCSDKCLM